MPVPVILVHGLRGSAADWTAQRVELEDRGHIAVTPELPGLGTRAEESFTIAHSIATIADAVAEASEPPLVVGVGVGAHLAIDSAAATTGIAGVVALGCGIRPLGWLLDSYCIASQANQFLPDKGAAISEGMADAFVRDTDRRDGAAPSRLFDDTVRQLHVLDTAAALARIDAPIWLVNGQYDRFRLQERSFLRAAQRARLVRMPGVRLADGIAGASGVGRLLLSIVDDLEHTG